MPTFNPDTLAKMAHQHFLDGLALLATLDPAKDSPEGKLLDLIAEAVEAYEKVKYPL